MQITNCDSTENASFKAKVQFEVLFRSGAYGKPVDRREQNGSMKNDEQRKDYPNRNPNATTPFSLRFFLLIIFHEDFILWTALERARDRKLEVCRLNLSGAFCTLLHH